MVHLRSLTLLGLLPALACAQLKTFNQLMDLGESTYKKGLGLFLSESQIAVMTKEKTIAPHPYAGRSHPGADPES